VEELFQEPIEVFLLVTGDRKEKFVPIFGKKHNWTDEVINHRKEKGSSWNDLFPYPYVFVSGRKNEKNRERDPEEDLENAKSSLPSEIGRLILNRVRANRVPPWLYEGNAFIAEIRMNETANDCHVSMTKYREEVSNKQGSKAKYFEFMKQQVNGKLDRSLLQIFSLELNNLDWADSMKAWSFLEFLIARYKPEYRTLMRQPVVPVEEIQPIHVDAASKARKPKDPAAAPLPGKAPKEEAPLPTGPIKVEGPDAVQITEGSREERAIEAANSEAWLTAVLRKDIAAIEEEWRMWILAHP